jgi:hypothetical protein
VKSEIPFDQGPKRLDQFAVEAATDKILTLPVPQRLPEPGRPGVTLRMAMNARIFMASKNLASNGAMGAKDYETLLRLLHRLAVRGVAPVRMVEALRALEPAAVKGGMS